MASNDDDRREYRRLNSVHLVKYVLRDSAGKEIDSGTSRSLDISTGGMRIEIDKNIPINSIIELDVSIRDEINRFKGEVIHVVPLEDGSNKYGAGIKVIL